MNNRSKYILENGNNIYEIQKSGLVEKLKNQQKNVIGYLCNFAPPELIFAAGMVPYRIMGNMGDTLIEADNYIEPFCCPYVRNCFEQDLKGNLNFLDGLIIPHSCDSAQRIYGIWKHYRDHSFSCLVNVPHKVNPSSITFFKRELDLFKESIENHVGNKISDDQLKRAIELFNENRLLVQELYELRKKDPPLLSGTEVFKILVSGMYIQPDEFNVYLKKIKDDAAVRSLGKNILPRIMFCGSVLDDLRLIELIEKAGSSIVIDDTCIGTKSNFRQVDTSLGLMDGLAKCYFEDFMCPRTDRGPNRQRFDYILDFINEYSVQGVVFYSLSFCDPHKLDYPDLRDYLNENGIPVLLVDDDYTLSNIGTIANRVEAFIEML